MILLEAARREAQATLIARHYTGSVPSGKSVYIQFDAAIVVFSIPANKNIARYLGFERVWELSRLWAPDGHEPNLLTKALSHAVAEFRTAEPAVEALVSYADPNVGHHGGIYKAASWIACGQSEESRLYKNAEGAVVSRRAFHSGKKSLRKAEILALGYVQLKGQGKLRYVKPLTGKARRAFAKRATALSKAA